nr:bacterial regulator helix-turn-hlix, LysR family protein [Janthinobacterium agaricidamnosum]
MLDHVRRCNAQLEQMHADLSPFVAGLAQRVTLFANNNVISSFLPHDLARFFEANRQVRVTLEERMGTETVAAVASGRADLGIVTVTSDEPSLQFIRYREDRFVLVAPRSYGFDGMAAMRFRRCLDYPFISLQNGTSLHAFLTNQASALGQTLDIRVQVSSHRSILNLVAAGAGLTIVPLSTLAADDHRQLAVIALEDEWALRHHRICVRRDTLQQNAMVRTLIDTLTVSAPLFMVSAARSD